MFPLPKSSTEQITDLMFLAGNLRVACELCARVERTEEIAGMHKIFERQMVSALRTAAKMLSDLESSERSGASNQNNEPSPAP
ncbi:hypothetical protein HH212_22910 [Massilia forsythiae]|uniref:Uncharacterized protein n=1 Tax=Massilia forsythiae TaxID=2728020 RepID=A0A7Z2ZVV2_9BURK|nr:hypothetical protein [Massilia forsythiae]QJE02517.1 hypothetical protein HH212_22910 [Massilia forsythiae]